MIRGWSGTAGERSPSSLKPIEIVLFLCVSPGTKAIFKGAVT